MPEPLEALVMLVAAAILVAAAFGVGYLLGRIIGGRWWW